MRVATIDIGTNTVLLLVAETGRDGALGALHESATITRLGERVDQTRALARGDRADERVPERLCGDDPRSQGRPHRGCGHERDA